MPQALPNPTGDVFTLTEATLNEGLQASRESPRLRIILPVQRDQNALVQRLLNFLQPGTYIRPHRHPLPHATESICLLSGALDLLTFDHEGNITSRHSLSKKAPLIDLQPNLWHSIIVTEPDTVIFEIKKGPYHAETDKHFAPWSPPEDAPDVEPFLKSLQ